MLICANAPTVTPAANVHDLSGVASGLGTSRCRVATVDPAVGNVTADWTLSSSEVWKIMMVRIPAITNYYLQDATSVTSYRRRTSIWQAKDVHLGPEEIASANALYDAAATYLARAKDPLIHYGETEPFGLDAPPTWRIGDTIALQYRGMATDRFGDLVKWLDVDANAIVLGQQQAFGVDGVRQWKLSLASAIKQPRSFVDTMSQVDQLARLPAL